MTRINVIDADLLTDQHLFAEYREITRVFALVRQACEKYPQASVLAKIPPTYRLNSGHVLFFYNKLDFIERRYFALRDEVMKRGFNVTRKDNLVDFRKLIDPVFYQDFSPNQQDKAINIQRLIEKITARPNWYKINGTLIQDDDYCHRLEELVVP